MRHGKKFNHLGRTAPHRKAMLSNMAASLIINKRISTTVAKAKALRKYVEPLITKAKDNTTHSRRTVFSYLQDKESVTELFNVVADKSSARPGGYTRILKTGSRLGDNAEMCIMELVDFNELMLEEAKPKKSRRSRRGGKSKAKAPEAEVSQSEEASENAEGSDSEAQVIETAEVETATEEEEVADTAEEEEKKGDEPQAEAEDHKDEDEKKEEK